MLYLRWGFDDTFQSRYRALDWRSIFGKCLGFIGRIYRAVLHRAWPKEMGSEDNTDNKPRNYENIGPTAALVAYYRSFSDIPFAKQVALEINAEELSEGLAVKDQALLCKALIAFEARFKSIDAVLQQYPNLRHFIEIPAGFSTRGLAMTMDNPAISYVECDLRGMLIEKQKLISHLLAQENKQPIPNLRYEAASILDGEQLSSIASQLPVGQVAIITEGLFSYLTRDEKLIASQNVRKVLAARGGVWVVTDLTRLFKPDDSKAAELRNRISTATGFSPVTGCFDSISEAKRFFGQLGFKVHDYRRSEVMDELSTREASDLSSHQVKRFLIKQATFALEV
jgi:O-methyltransferase involved in polyketide biosynthesis